MIVWRVASQTGADSFDISWHRTREEAKTVALQRAQGNEIPVITRVEIPLKPPGALLTWLNENLNSNTVL